MGVRVLEAMLVYMDICGEPYFDRSLAVIRARRPIKKRWDGMEWVRAVGGYFVWSWGFSAFLLQQMASSSWLRSPFVQRSAY